MHKRTTVRHWSLIITAIAILFAGTNSACGDTAVNSEADETVSLWELGVMAVGARLPHYIGSDEYENYLYPLPYVIYRGEVLRADRDGIRGIFYRGEKFETQLSFWGNPPVPDNNLAREGMPNLDAIGEVGPALRWYFFRYGWQNHMYLQWAWRAAFSFDFDGGVAADYQGWRSSIDLRYQNSSLFQDQHLSLFFRTGLNFSNGSYNDYFYGVHSQFATPQRRAFQADGGYAGLTVSGGFSKKLTSKLSLGAYARWDNLDSAVFEDSPLVRAKNTYALGCLVIWKLAKSKVPAP